jgi:hypothetical protein
MADLTDFQQLSARITSAAKQALFRLYFFHGLFRDTSI